MSGATDPHAVLGVAPTAGPEEVRAARRALTKALHPDARRDDDPAERANAQRRLAEINAAYDELSRRWRAEAAGDPGREEGALIAFSVDAFRPEAFEALVIAAADVGDVTDTDEPFALEVFVEGPPTGFCRLELFPDAGGSVVTAASEAVDPAVVCDTLVAALVRLGLHATRVQT